MLQNIKVDIIYYNTNTDFEMEFNLCGCCRMRLLTDKVPDKKTMVHSLARAVSRSRVIIIVGNLFGETGVTEIAAKAIGGNISLADNKTYGISGDEDIHIIDGSVPLVTPEGYFGGCIIESGPQTLILLSENKNIRKTVMKTLIHPYIEELSSVEPDEKANFEPVSDREEAEQATEIPSEVDEAVSEIEDETDFSEMDKEIEAYSEELDLIFASEETQETDENIEEGMDGLIADDDEIEMTALDDSDFGEEESEFLFEDNTVTMREFIIRNEKYYDQQLSGEELLTEDYEDFQIKKSRFLNIPITIVAVFLLAVIAILCYHIFYVPATHGETPGNYIREIFNTLFG